MLAFVETFELTHDRRYLDRAVETQKFVESGESNDLGGGIWWRDLRDSKNACSCAPAICGALRVMEYTSDPGELAFAKRVYEWTHAHLQDQDGLFFDHMKLDGSIEKTRWSYNTALMLRANLLLWRTTHEQKYLDEARRIAAAAEAHWFRAADGALTDEGCFAHLLCENLLYLQEIDHDPRHVKFVRAALDYLYQHCRIDGDFYPRRWDAPLPKEDKVDLLFQASAVRGFLVAARLLSPFPQKG